MTDQQRRDFNAFEQVKQQIEQVLSAAGFDSLYRDKLEDLLVRRDQIIAKHAARKAARIMTEVHGANQPAALDPYLRGTPGARR